MGLANRLMFPRPSLLARQLFRPEFLDSVLVKPYAYHRLIWIALAAATLILKILDGPNPAFIGTVKRFISTAGDTHSLADLEGSTTNV